MAKHKLRAEEEIRKIPKYATRTHRRAAAAFSALMQRPGRGEARA